ncbi:hypothetical protein BDZ45DRAFT_754955 [Acephala macrosclerotiorum]|nr:hypothetical protein BDZ45DRAFT_754955 [Acephala macrosclerotiorum]
MPPKKAAQANKPKQKKAPKTVSEANQRPNPNSNKRSNASVDPRAPAPKKSRIGTGTIPRPDENDKPKEPAGLTSKESAEWNAIRNVHSSAHGRNEYKSSLVDIWSKPKPVDLIVHPRPTASDPYREATKSTADRVPRLKKDNKKLGDNLNESPEEVRGHKINGQALKKENEELSRKFQNAEDNAEQLRNDKDRIQREFLRLRNTVIPELRREVEKARGDWETFFEQRTERELGVVTENLEKEKRLAADKLKTAYEELRKLQENYDYLWACYQVYETKLKEVDAANDGLYEENGLCLRPKGRIQEEDDAALVSVQDIQNKWDIEVSNHAETINGFAQSQRNLRNPVSPIATTDLWPPGTPIGPAPRHNFLVSGFMAGGPRILGVLPEYIQ